MLLYSLGGSLFHRLSWASSAGKDEECCKDSVGIFVPSVSMQLFFFYLETFRNMDGEKRNALSQINFLLDSIVCLI